MGVDWIKVDNEIANLASTNVQANAKRLVAQIQACKELKPLATRASTRAICTENHGFSLEFIINEDQRFGFGVEIDEAESCWYCMDAEHSRSGDLDLSDTEFAMIAKQIVYRLTIRETIRRQWVDWSFDMVNQTKHGSDAHRVANFFAQLFFGWWDGEGKHLKIVFDSDRIMTVKFLNRPGFFRVRVPTTQEFKEDKIKGTFVLFRIVKPD